MVKKILDIATRGGVPQPPGLPLPRAGPTSLLSYVRAGPTSLISCVRAGLLPNADYDGRKNVIFLFQIFYEITLYYMLFLKFKVNKLIS
jgi:hypothetical protein